MTTQRVGTYGFILDDKQDVLLVKRAAHDSHPNMWELPGGGVEFGEDPKTAVIREVHEEAGIDISVRQPFSVVSHMREKQDEQIFRIVYLCDILNPSQPIRLSQEHSEFRWVKSHAAIVERSSHFLDLIFADYTRFINR